MTKKIAVIGLGYVGLPLAVEFGKVRPTVGFDIKQERVAALEEGHDSTLEATDEDLAAAVHLTYTSKMEDIKDASYYIVAVPTPIDKNRRPDLTPLIKATEVVGKVLSKGDIVVYESTVYPGATEEECVPVLARESGLKYNEEFFCGYSPERINPGDKVNTLRTIVKVVSGSTPETAQELQEMYNVVCDKTFMASNIRVAEAAKVVENAQRDINIAFVNELAKICQKMNIDTLEVIEAMGTKWNALGFKPGLVGGHCIGVDPYYLTHKAQELNYHPEIILAGRRLNDDMGYWVAKQVVKLMNAHDHRIKGSHVLIMGITFKENCPDIRNTRVVDVVEELNDFGCHIDIYDPWADAQEVKEEYDITLLETLPTDMKKYSAIVMAVAHDQFKTLDFAALKSEEAVIYDIKGVLPKDFVDGRL
ncbi:MAG: Vi polysaccharide biosynthesis protein VipA/TviB [Bacteroidetes bacterium]|nr:MAG: Vi polysaccharide biosynthesis protein VipA/TviB [Bacteroidota bacterium]